MAKQFNTEGWYTDFMKEAGVSRKDASVMFHDIYQAKEGYYNEAKARGMTGVDAEVYARDRVNMELDEKVAAVIGAERVREVKEASGREAEMITGNFRGEGGAFNEMLSKLQSVAKNHPLAYRMIFGFPRVGFNVASHSLWNSPYGLKRMAVEAHLNKQGRTAYAQSLGGRGDLSTEMGKLTMYEMQRRRRIDQMMAGSLFLTGIASALIAQNGQPEEEQPIWLDFAGPTDKKRKQTWLSNGHVPFSISFRGSDGVRIPVRYDRGPMEVIGVPLALMAAGKDAVGSTENHVVSALGQYLLSVSGFAGMRSDNLTERSVSQKLAGFVTGFVPFGQAFRTVNKVAPVVDTSTTAGSIISQIPVAPAFLGEPAIALLGENISDQAGSTLRRLGFPVTISRQPDPDRARIYRMFADLDMYPAGTERAQIEKEHGPITDAEYRRFKQEYGEALVRSLPAPVTRSLSIDKENAQRELDKIGREAVSFAKDMAGFSLREAPVK